MHTFSGYSLVTQCSFDKSANEVCYYRGKDCIEILCKNLRDLAMKKINYEKKEEIILTNEEKESYEKQEICYICREEFCTDIEDDEYVNKKKVKDHCHYTGKFRGAAHSICNLRCEIQKEIPVIFHNGSTYDYHFIFEELVKNFEGNCTCLGESTEKYITFSVPIKKIIIIMIIIKIK